MPEPVNWKALNDPESWPVTRVGWMTDLEREIMRQRGQDEVNDQADDMTRKYNESRNE